MKDLPHHIKKLNRKVIRSMRREEVSEELPEIPPFEDTLREKKKKSKQKMREERLAHVPSDLTPEERNKKMKKRVPVFDRINNAKPRVSKPSQKKTPRI